MKSEISSEAAVSRSYSEKHFTVCDGCQLAEIMHPYRLPLPFSSYSLSHATLAAGGKTLRHRLKTSSETYYILSGECAIFVGERKIKAERGTSVAVPAGAVQHVENNGGSELEFLCIVTPPWNAEDEEVLR